MYEKSANMNYSIKKGVCAMRGWIFENGDFMSYIIIYNVMTGNFLKITIMLI